MHQPERGAGQAENGRAVIEGKLRKIAPCSGVLLSPVLCYNKRKEKEKQKLEKEQLTKEYEEYIKLKNKFEKE